MSAVYNGNCEWDLSAFDQTSVDAWGFDTITRTYSGRNDKINTFVDQWKHDRTIRHPDFQFATYHSISIAPSVLISSAQVVFKGVVGNTLPGDIVTTGTRVQSISIEYTGPAVGDTSGVTGTFEYKAPYKRVRWFSYGTLASMQRRTGTSRAFNIGPLYDDMLDDIVVLNRTGTRAELNIAESSTWVRGYKPGFPNFAPIGGVKGNGMKVEAYNAVAQFIESDYTCEQVGSEILMESSTVEMRLIEANMAYVADPA